MLMVAATQCQGYRPATARRVYGACHLLWQLDDESPALLLLPRAALEGVITFSLTAVPQVQLQLLLLLHVVAVVVLQVMPFPMTNCLAISVQRQKHKAFCPAASLMINFPKQIARPLTMTKKLKTKQEKPLEKRLSGRVSWTRMCSAKSKSICNFNLQFYFGLDTATAINIAAARQRQK